LDVKAMVEQLFQMGGKLVASERLATLGQFSGNISHELRNPLGVIDSSVYYLKMKLKDADEKVHEHLDRIKLSVDNSTAIIESMLNLTRMKAPELTKLDLAAVTRDALATSKLPKTIISKLDFPEGEVLVNGDHEQLRMAFKNIIKNASEAMEARGTLTVTIRTAADGRAEVSFTDTGSGIAAEDMNSVFQPLFSRKAKGIGLGLSITKMIIEKHGGTIEAKSEPGKGATIVIQLPLYADNDKEA
jgi:signal transduction histidine kinase